MHDPDDDRDDRDHHHDSELRPMAACVRALETILVSNWAAALGAELRRGAADGGDSYDRWPAALETLLRQIAGIAETDNRTAAWQRAAHTTPHGKPIPLENDPMRRSTR
jgi:hypothetical protein